MPRWFLSYHSPDESLASRLKLAITARDPSSTVFFAPQSLRAGGLWSPQLAQEIAEATAFILLIGASGVGPLGALAILKQFRNVEEAIARAGEIECARWRHAVQDSRDAILLSKKLVTIDCDVPLENYVSGIV